MEIDPSTHYFDSTTSTLETWIRDGAHTHTHIYMFLCIYLCIFSVPRLVCELNNLLLVSIFTLKEGRKSRRWSSTLGVVDLTCESFG